MVCEASSVPDVRERWSTFHFSEANPSGPGQRDVAALLRRVAYSLDELGDVQVQDITFWSDPTGDGEDDLRVTVYYDRAQRRR